MWGNLPGSPPGKPEKARMFFRRFAFLQVRPAVVDLQRLALRREHEDTLSGHALGRLHLLAVARLRTLAPLDQVQTLVDKAKHEWPSPVALDLAQRLAGEGEDAQAVVRLMTDV